LGITEAGGLIGGTVKSAVGLGMLLWEGIGDTVRVSLATDPVKEPQVGWEILKSLNLRQRGVNIIACPSCARQQFNVTETVGELEQRLAHIDVPMTVSIIGCVVNGPGEAMMTDIGLTGGGKGNHLVYISGGADHKVSSGDIVEHIVDLVEARAAALRVEAPEHADAAQ
ncbi:MAG: flavodoxin-dependent (E)-4-hydroxy-3-methylbut-2-enyl-diphosphate synthase, partial [Rhodospirillaceae bacterium]|nr:flavodoxin-dependent (E)-4-hydroxy-3-methylbut-2-enyl-diphosphate synthase [Rhodospirillaceae bacterium]